MCLDISKAEFLAVAKVEAEAETEAKANNYATSKV